jgi:REP element-mobilizing transposase RayT
MSDDEEHDYLRRLPPEAYQGRAYVHWSMTMEDRRTGWLIPIFYYKFREILTHTCFRFGLCTPIYCCMPDHIHLLWIGIAETCDQRLAARYFRKNLNVVLEKLGAQFQSQPYDHVLREEDRERNAFETAAEYIAQNPERAKLVPTGGFRDYKYTGCLVPGYPELSPWQPQYWDTFWKVYSHLLHHGFLKRPDLN